MVDVIQRSTVGVGGCLATIGLQQVNHLLSIGVGLLTIVYLSLGIRKLISEYRKK